MPATKKETCKCYKCGGNGVLSWAYHVANGVCFVCKGKGEVEVKPSNFKLNEMPEQMKKQCEWILKQTECPKEITWKQISKARKLVYGMYMEQYYPGIRNHFNQVFGETFAQLQNEHLDKVQSQWKLG